MDWAPVGAGRVVAQRVSAAPVGVLALVDVEVAVVSGPAGDASTTARAASGVGARRVVAAALERQRVSENVGKFRVSFVDR